MDSFSLFDKLSSDASKTHGYMKSNLGDMRSKYIECFKKAERTLSFRMGELYSVDNRAFAQEACEILKSKGDGFRFDLTCGKTIICASGNEEEDKGRTQNWFIETLEKELPDDPRVTVCYNTAESYVQHTFGYLHSIDVDQNDVYFEMPHSYLFLTKPSIKKHDSQPWVGVEGNREFSEAFERLHKSSTNLFVCLYGDVALRAIDENTKPAPEFKKAVKGLVYNTPSGLLECLRSV